jgi:hypothetical protein
VTGQLVNLKQIAEMFGVHYHSTHKWPHDHLGFPPIVRVEEGSNWHLFSLEAIKQWGVLTGRWDDLVDLPIKKSNKCPCCEEVRLNANT